MNGLTRHELQRDERAVGALERIARELGRIADALERPADEGDALELREAARDFSEEWYAELRDVDVPGLRLAIENAAGRRDQRFVEAYRAELERRGEAAHG